MAGRPKTLFKKRARSIRLSDEVRELIKEKYETVQKFFDAKIEEDFGEIHEAEIVKSKKGKSVAKESHAKKENFGEESFEEIDEESVEESFGEDYSAQESDEENLDEEIEEIDESDF